MKKIFYTTILLVWMSVNAVTAQEPVRLTVRDGIEGYMKSRIEKNASELLTEINAAYRQQRALNTARLSMTDEARRGLAALWENVRFKCDDKEVVESCLRAGGYQIRNIPLMMRPRNNSTTQDDEYQEGVISFDRNTGSITRFNFAMAMNAYLNILKNGATVEEIETLHQIIGYVEQFRTAYEEKDLNFLEQVFSENALIITGTVINVVNTDAAIRMPTGKVHYNVLDKTTYLSRLKTRFNDPDLIKIKVDFEYPTLKVQRHPNPIYKDVYGVTVHQQYSSSHRRKEKDYSDDGYLFMLWDFHDKNKPQIHRRTWQPKWLDEKKTKELPKEEIFKVGEFSGFKL